MCVCVGRGEGAVEGREREWVGRGNGTVGASERECVGEGDSVVKESRSIYKRDVEECVDGSEKGE